ncbi:hypothetical protein E4U13_005634 [Claviceps humidiphila]|uniref:Uncharacterized protein n=1 Tax=Claviceps humidiphila TaxID=1294629 RepID=A0A9P7TV07_9HYPO|nr:hypothetical protein E4U13_005634 [Claviceps humidiphila]
MSWQLPTPTRLHKLSRSKLNPSLLLTLFITPNWKNLSSPPAVLPPIYHFSAPRASRNPSLLLSLPRLRPDVAAPGTGIPPDVEAPAAPRGEWIDKLLRGELRVPACWADEDVPAAVVEIPARAAPAEVCAYPAELVEEDPTTVD